MDKHTKKIIAPIVIAVIIVLYLLLYASIAFATEVPMLFRIIGLVIPLLLAGVMIAMLVERIKEIRSGEEDDLSEY
ncbi:MAG: hypothetical protein J1E64_03205 [Acetatifactor sp.]|nr:hypothetical protein [Acetatifactor sp.]